MPKMRISGVGTLYANAHYGSSLLIKLISKNSIKFDPTKPLNIVSLVKILAIVSLILQKDIMKSDFEGFIMVATFENNKIEGHQ